MHPTAKVSEEVNRMCSPWDTTVQLSTSYADAEPSNSPPPKFPTQYDRLSQQQLLGFLYINTGTGLCQRIYDIHHMEMANAEC